MKIIIIVKTVKIIKTVKIVNKNKSKVFKQLKNVSNKLIEKMILLDKIDFFF